MTHIKQLKSGRLFMGKLKHGADLLEEITTICIENKINLGQITAIGAVKKANLAYYDQTTHKYLPHMIDRPLEIINLTGNISLKNNQPMVHAHITLSDRQDNAYGGHLATGTIIFACEIIIEEFTGHKFKREFDQQTSLPLWNLNQ